MIDEVNQKKMLRGSVASYGKTKGKVKILSNKNLSEFTIESGDILVCEMTTPDHVIYMKQASAIVTDKGGILCHAAIVAREFGISCIGGTNNATSFMKEGDFVEVDAKKGEVRILR